MVNVRRDSLCSRIGSFSDKNSIAEEKNVIVHFNLLTYSDYDTLWVAIPPLVYLPPIGHSDRGKSMP
jgi:hypothetical protein